MVLVNQQLVYWGGANPYAFAGAFFQYTGRNLTRSSLLRESLRDFCAPRGRLHVPLINRGFARAGFLIAQLVCTAAWLAGREAGCGQKFLR